MAVAVDVADRDLAEQAASLPLGLRDPQEPEDPGGGVRILNAHLPVRDSRAGGSVRACSFDRGSR